MSTVIVFGPTGNIASIAAQTAQKRGAKVILAMRDPSKSISGFDAEDEKKGNYSRVQADLTKPDSVASAVQTTGATRAFIYIAHGTPDGMKATLTALKSAGITFVVFLSSSTIQVNPSDVTPDDIIPFMHAQVEMNLAQVFGQGSYVSVRPGRFATNLLRYKQGILDGNVRLYGGDYKFDNIAAEDMGTVSGELLVNGPRNGEEALYLYAPRWSTLRDSVQTVADVLGKQISITQLNEEEGVEEFVKANVPKPLAQYMVNKMASGEDREIGNESLHETGRANILTYAGRPAMELEEWVKANRQLFVA